MKKLKLDMKLRFPLVVILGATGSGKTRLSLELAKRFCGEIIGADSMQVYKALDIITAKATKEELSVAKHHLIDILEPFETFTVTEYKNKALIIINNLLSQNKLPIVVGGTNYYIESILWKILIDNPLTNKKMQELTHYNHLSNEELHKKLQLLDSDMAQRLHPNNRRKVLRSLEVLEQYGRKHSELLTEQQTADGGSSLGGGLRFKNCLIFWLCCNQSVLDERLNKRVDEMLENGLIKELTDFHKMYKENMSHINEIPDYTKGIFQSIGFKEFHDYLILDENRRCSEEGNILLMKGIDDLKLVTRRYARKQKRWIVSRFLGRNDRNVPPVYELSTNDVNKWNESVLSPAVDIIESFINGTQCKYVSLPTRDVESNPNSKDKTYKCETCDRIFIGDYQWKIHLNSKKHKVRLFKAKVSNK